MEYDIIFISGEVCFDHPMSGVGLLKRLLEKYGYSVGVIEQPQKVDDVCVLGKPKLFFAVGSGSFDSMVRNYTPLKKSRFEDKNSNTDNKVMDRAVIVYCDWLKQKFKESIISIGGTEASLRRFTHYDYWKNSLRRPILFDSRADILMYGNSEKQILELAKRLTENNSKESLYGILGTCVIAKEVKEGIEILPTFTEVSESKEKFCTLQNMFTNTKDLAQKIDNRYVIQFKSPKYTSADLDEYYEMPFKRDVPKELRGFQFSVVTHRGCIGNCNFCSLKLLQGDKIVSRSKESILREIKYITTLPYFKGNIDDLGGPSANMYGMDCYDCNGECINCNKLDKSYSRILDLLKNAREIEGVQNVYIRSGIRFDLCSEEYLTAVLKYHTANTLRIAPEHVNSNVLKLMNKDKGDLKKFQEMFKKVNSGKELSYYFMTAHPGSSLIEAKELANYLKFLENSEAVQVFTPTPMTVSTCMYYTGLNPKDMSEIYVPYTYKEKKEQKRVIFEK